MAIKKSKFWEPFWSHQHCQFCQFGQILRQMGRICSAVQLVAPKRLPDFHFFNCPGFRIFILCEIHCYLCPHIFWVYHFSLSQCVQQYSSPCIITPLILNLSFAFRSKTTVKPHPSGAAIGTPKTPNASGVPTIEVENSPVSNGSSTPKKLAQKLTYV